MTVPGEGQTEKPSSQAVTALVIGLIGILTCCGTVLSPIAWYLGVQEQRAIREGRSPAAGEALAKIAIILGIVGTAVLALLILWVFLMGGLAVISGFLNR
jgi:uncharacterized membrane protein YidH (DUF202 family)